jgi:hypothetical protein
MLSHDAPLPGRRGEELGGALGKPQAGIRDDQPDTGVEMLEERGPTRLVLLRALADGKNLSVAVTIHADRDPQRHVANLTRLAALYGVLAFDRPIAPRFDRSIDHVEPCPLGRGAFWPYVQGHSR